MIKEATCKIGGVYVYCNLRGGDGGRAMFDGGSVIIMNGEVVAAGG
jgi:hypothetical protein